jgi:Putative Flp pilus-assembly TadE/G-like
MSGTWWSRRNARGGTLALTAVMIVGLLSVLALAIDLGMLYKTKGEAQRAADAAALAGADAFRQFENPNDAVTTAHNQAMNLASRNFMTGGMIDTTSEVTVQVIPDSSKVRVWVRRAAVRTWFARMFGVASTPIGAVAAARALNASSSMCIKPFALADYWAEATQDVNGNHLSDLGTGNGRNNTSENWNYDASQGDRYAQDGQGNATGLGSSYRNSTTNGGTLTPTLARDPRTNFEYVNDGGRMLNIKFGDPQQAYAPGYFSPWRPPDCGGRVCSGGSDYRNNISRCNTSEIDRTESTPYLRETGNMIGPTSQGIQDLIDNDPLGLNWTERDLNGNNVMEPGEYGATDRNGRFYTPEELIALGNPRIGVVPMMNPAYGMGSGGGPSNELRFNAFRYMFFDGCVNANNLQRSGRCGNNDIVIARFLTPAVRGTGGAEPGTNPGPEVKIIRLVE